MRKFSCLLLVGLLSVVYGCSPSVSRKPFFDALEPATVLTLEQDTTLVLVRDFFPSADKVEKTDSPHLKVVPHPGYDTVMVVLRDDTPLMTVLNVHIEGQTGHIPVRKKVPVSEEAPRLAVFPPLPDTDALFTLKAENTPATLYVFWQNSLVQTVHITDSYNVMLPGFAALQDRSWIRAWAVNEHGISNDLLIPLEKGRPVIQPERLDRKDKHTLIMYQVFIDRFFNGNPSNDRRINSSQVHPKVDYFGGDLEGVLRKIDEGFFNDLGINTIWLSPITQNPYDAWGQIEDPKTRFSGYHGYWPLYITKVDDRFGNDSIFTRLLHQAHGKQMNVILDHVANHMHQDAPTLREHPDWVTSPVTPDGRPNFELWDEFRKFDFSRPDVCAALSDSAMYWLEKFNLDGFRHDATKHIDELFWRTLTDKIVRNFPDRTVFQIGETYGSPSLINSYVKKGMLDGQFDFNLYHTFLNSTVNTEGSFVDLWNELQSGLMQYGYHNLMGNISGNHDKARYISLAGGALSMDEDHKLAGWKRNIGVGSDIGYEYLAMLHAFNMTLPGVPCIYYGDEIGMPGANDPDNRRMMVFDGYTPMQIRLKERVKRLTSLRKENMALLYGDLFPLHVSPDVLAYVRIYMDQVVAVCINKGDDFFDIRSLELPFGLNTDDLVPYMGETMVAPKGFAIMTND